METEKLVEIFTGENNVDFQVVEELIRRPDTLKALEHLLQFPEKYHWRVLHDVLYVLGRIQPAGLDALLYVLINRQESLGDDLTEVMAPLLATFGPCALDKLEKVLAYEWLDQYVKGAAIGAIARIGWKYPESRKRAVDKLLEIVEKDDDRYIVAAAICELADMQEESAIPFFEKAYALGKVDTSVIDLRTAITLAKGEPLFRDNPRGTEEHVYWRKLHDAESYLNAENFRDRGVSEQTGQKEASRNGITINAPNKKIKIGRNDPCHCGSGKKYKKCCLKREQE